MFKKKKRESLILSWGCPKEMLEMKWDPLEGAFITSPKGALKALS